MRYALLLVMIVVSTGRASDNAVRPPAAETATKAQQPLHDADIRDLKGFWGNQPLITVGGDLGGKKLNDVLAGEAVTRVVVLLNDTDAQDGIHLTQVARLIESNPAIEPFWTTDKATGFSKKADPSLDRLRPYFAVLLEGKNGRLTGLLFHSNQKDLIFKVFTEKGVGIIKTPRPLPPPILKDRAAAADLVKALSDSREDVRASAAQRLRTLLAADPTAAPNYHAKAYWQQRAAQLKPGMALDEALKVLLPGLSPVQRPKTFEGGSGDGNTGVERFRLDDYWVVDLYVVEPGDKALARLHDSAPDLTRAVRRVSVSPPAGYTGTWRTWYVNGQMANQCPYRDGQCDGTYTDFYDDGCKAFQRQFTMGVIHGPETGWHRNGKRAYEGQYDHGQQAGTWRFWNDSGQVESSQEYKEGKPVEGPQN